MPVKPLTTLCMQTILENIKLVFSVGTELPHDNPHVQKILARVGSANQLREMELNSPQLQGYTEKFWKELIRRHFPGSKRKNYVPSDPTGWHKVYKRHKKEHDESLQAANAALKSAFDDIAVEKEKNVSVLLNRSQLPKPPRTGRAFATRRGGQQTTNTSSLNFTAGSRTKLNSGKNVLKRARREAMDAAAQQRGPLGRLSRAGGVAPNMLNAAPSSFLERNRVASQPQIRAPSGPSAKKPAPANKRHASPLDDGPEPIVLNVSDDEPSDPLFGDTDDQGPPAKKQKLGPKRSECPAKDPLFDSDDEEDAESEEASPKPRTTKRSGAAPSHSSPMKRMGGPLLPGKPGAGRFLNHSSATSGGKATASSSRASTSAAGAKGTKSTPNTSQGASPPQNKPVSSKGAAKPAADAGRGPSPPQDRPAAPSGSARPPGAGLPRKKKVDIFMKPKPRRQP